MPCVNLEGKVLTVILESFIVEASGSIDGLQTSSIASHEISALYHEPFDHTVELAVFVPNWSLLGTIFTGTELAKVLRCSVVSTGSGPDLLRETYLGSSGYNWILMRCLLSCLS